MKASNTRVMVAAYRLLVNKLMARGGDLYPLHLGVTEAGDGDDGRIKSAIGISTLLADGIGDTVRVSLTEPPEAEMPVGNYLVTHIEHKMAENAPVDTPELPVNPYQYQRRETRQVANFGSESVPRVLSDFSHKTSGGERLAERRALLFAQPRQVAHDGARHRLPLSGQHPQPVYAAQWLARDL